MDSEQPQMPPVFAGISRRRFLQIVRITPFGHRLWSPNSTRECRYVRRFLDVVEETGNPLYGRLPWYLTEETLKKRPLRICLAFVRWFGTNCGQSAIQALMHEMRVCSEEDAQD